MPSEPHVTIPLLLVLSVLVVATIVGTAYLLSGVVG